MTRLVRGLGVLLVASGVTLQAVTYVGFEQLTVAATAIGFTSTEYTPPGQLPATQALCRLRTAQISFTIDGTTPTTIVGTLLEIGETLIIAEPDLIVSFRAIRTGGTSGQLDCTYVRP